MFHVERSYDVIVVGGGHAGVEAAAAACRRGANTLLVSQRRDAIGVMSCNPSIGGLGKGHLVREVDALGGLMALAADHAAIHHRMLNASKGSAVHGPRVQADRRLYAQSIRRQLKAMPMLTVLEGEVIDISSADADHRAMLADGSAVSARAVVLATGTFLGGRIFRGEERQDGGRVEERAATRLADRLRALSLPMRRMKTGTPPRIDGQSIDWAAIERQPSDDGDWSMSFVTNQRANPALFCGVTRTTVVTHDIIRASMHRSPLTSGAIEAGGPRYCPSIEDKVARFGDRDGHQIFLEPEGLDDATVYPNGISTSLPGDVQAAFVRSIPGMELARITVSGYAVEYDHVDPRALDHRLSLHDMPGVFCAGQINGTTGYEEAAAQGLVAGANAAARALDRAPLLLDRPSSYLGVMIDDLVLQGVSEPYRMLTARAEYRLSLRADNAATRLSPIAERHGLLTEERRRWVTKRSHLREAVLHDETLDVPPSLLAEIAEDARYRPYVERQQEEIARVRRDGAIAIPIGAEVRSVNGLSNEMVERLMIARPETLGAASRVAGITPAALTALWLHAKRTVPAC